MAKAKPKPKRRRHRRRSRLLTQHRERPGAPPGELRVDADALPSSIRVIAYGPDQLLERDGVAPEQLGTLAKDTPVIWVDVIGLGTATVLESVARRFGIHPLELEDVINLDQRPKVEDWPDHRYIVLRMVREDQGGQTEQVSLFVGHDWVLTFQERPGDSFDEVRERIRRGGGRVRGAGADYLGYTLVDALVDRFYPLLEAYAVELEDLEDAVLARPEEHHMNAIHRNKRELFGLRRAIWPMRDAIGAMLRDGRVSGDTLPYWRDCHDHVLELMDIVELCRELAQGSMETYMSTATHRMNEIMKVLTMIATIFIPLSFVTGIYGMNFDDIPGLHSRWGFGVAIVAMLAVAVLMLLLFRRRGWIGGDDER